MVYPVKILCNIQFQIIETLRLPVSLLQPIMQAVDCFMCSPAYSASVAVRNELLFKIWVQLAIYIACCATRSLKVSDIIMRFFGS